MSTNKIKFNNFKPFGEKMQSFSQKPITLIYGQNSIGKSSLIHLMAYRHEIITSKKFDIPEINSGDTISLGGFMNFVHKKNKNTSIKLNYNIPNVYTNLKSKILLTIGFSKNSKKARPYNIKYILDDEVFIELTDNLIKVHSEHRVIQRWISKIKDQGKWTDDEINEYMNDFDVIQYKIEGTVEEFLGDTFEESSSDAIASYSDMDEDCRKKLKEQFLSWSKEDETTGYVVKDIIKERMDRWGWLDVDSEKVDEPLSENINKPKKKSFDLDCYLLDKENDILTLKHILIHLSVEVAKRINTKLFKSPKSFMYIGPLRFYPERNSVYKELDDYKNNSSEAFWNQLKDDPELIDKLNVFLKSLSIPYLIELRKLYSLDNLFNDNISSLSKNEIENNATYIEELVFVDNRSNTPVHNREMGLGVTQLLPILGNCIVLNNSTIAIEQPELHLHPRLQAEIADIFIMVNKQLKNEFIIETHSEHILLRLMKRMRNTAEGTIPQDDVLALTADDVCVLYVDNDGNNTTIKELKLSADGSLLDYWPDGFFEDDFDEVFS